VPEVDDAGDSTDDDAPVELAAADKEYLAKWLNPVYLESDALTKVSKTRVPVPSPTRIRQHSTACFHCAPCSTYPCVHAA